MHLVWRTNYKSIRSWIKFHKRNASASCIQLKKQDFARTPEAPFLSPSSPCISLPGGNITWSTMGCGVLFTNETICYSLARNFCSKLCGWDSSLSLHELWSLHSCCIIFYSMNKLQFLYFTSIGHLNFFFLVLSYDKWCYYEHLE